MLFVVLVIVVLAIALVLAIVLPTRLSGSGSIHPHGEVDDETEALRHHQPGGNTGSI